MHIFMLFLLFITGISFISLLFKKTFEESAPVYFLAVVTVLFFSGVVNNLLIGLFTVVAFSTLFIAYLVYFFMKNGHREIEKYIFTPGLFVFAFLFAFVYLIDINRHFGTWDEFSHWGVMIKELLRTNQFYLGSGTALDVHNDYPPALQLFEYFWMKVVGHYSEPNTFRALQLFTLSLMLPAFKGINHKKIIRLVSLLAIILVVPSALGYNMYSSIYIDMSLGMIFGYSLYSIMMIQKFSVFQWLNLFLSTFVLVSTKQIALFFVGILLLYIMIRFFVMHTPRLFRFDRTSFKREVILSSVNFGIIMVAAGAAYIIWNNLVKAAKLGSIAEYHTGSITLYSIIAVIKGTGPAYQRTTLVNYINAVCNTSPIVPFCKMTYFRVFLVFTALCMLLCLVFRDKRFSVQFRSFAILTPAAGILYAILMCFVYMFCFVGSESTELASYQRYMLTFWTGILMVMVLFSSVCSTENEISSKNPHIHTAAWALVCLLLCGFVTPDELYASFFRTNLLHQTVTYPYEYNMAQGLLEHTTLGKDKVYVISEGEDVYSYFKLKYYADPVRFNSSLSPTWSIGTAQYEPGTQQQNTQLNASEWSKILVDKKYTYVCVLHDDASFQKDFGQLFKGCSGALSGAIYRVHVIDRNQVELLKVS